MPHSKRSHLASLGIPIWRRRDLAPLQVETVDDPCPAAPLPVDALSNRRERAPDREPDRFPTPPSAIDGETAAAALLRIKTRVEGCTRCELHRTRKRTVFGKGAIKAPCMLIGEAPGEQEDRQGEPFVGRAGKLLDAMLSAIGLGVDQVYIANMIKCRPPGNRDPQDIEIQSCAEYLEGQIDALSPRLLVAVGRVAAQRLLSTTEPMARLRGRLHRHRPTGLPLLVMYHPAYLLRRPREKSKAWQDLLMLHSTLEGSASPNPS
ncbi:MAG: uracil-DNA glycosylase [Ectothiorhodospiraceae bacterium AqS1]|nr:uracil-DNA glycosylase [Ectothiorhodospiraceae bacterium AqS1]